MEKFSKEQLEELSKDYYKEGATAVYATSDGQFFYERHFAERHGAKHGLGVYGYPLTGDEAEVEAEAEVEVEDKVEAEVKQVLKKKRAKR